MSPAASLGRTLIAVGIVLIVAGGALVAFGRVPRLPGDIVVERPGLTIYAPLATMLLLSLLLTVIANLVSRR
jgi:hypothetical protein